MLGLSPAALPASYSFNAKIEERTCLCFGGGMAQDLTDDADPAQFR